MGCDRSAQTSCCIPMLDGSDMGSNPGSPHRQWVMLALHTLGQVMVVVTSPKSVEWPFHANYVSRQWSSSSSSSPYLNLNLRILDHDRPSYHSTNIYEVNQLYYLQIVKHIRRSVELASKTIKSTVTEEPSTEWINPSRLTDLFLGKRCRTFLRIWSEIGVNMLFSKECWFISRYHVSDALKTEENRGRCLTLSLRMKSTCVLFGYDDKYHLVNTEKKNIE